MSNNAPEIKKVTAMSPLANPVVNAIFANKETAGLAVASLIQAVLEEDEEYIEIDEIISVTPQRHHSNVNERGCRIDIEIVTKNNERVIFEVQISPESWIMQRNLFAASRIFTETSNPGDDSKEMAKNLPRIIVINIANFFIREDNNELIQPVKMMFTKKPQRVAVENLKIYNVQLPRISDILEDFSKPWYCWAYAMYKAYSEKMTIGEVVEMTPQLQTYAGRDAGFRQYCEQYGRVASDPEVRDEYFDWVDGLMREAGVRHAAEEIGRKEGLKKGLEKGLEKGLQEGLEKGLQEGLEKGLQEGLEKGLQEGLEKGLQEGLEKGLQEGLEKGLQKGLQEGLEKGLQEGTKAEREKWQSLVAEKEALIAELLEKLGESKQVTDG